MSSQLLFGILSGKLAPGEKLLRVRNLARHLKIHGNTMLAVYLDLAQCGWMHGQTGSGVFVRRLALPSAGDGLDELARGWLAEVGPEVRAVPLGTDLEPGTMVLAQSGQVTHVRTAVRGAPVELVHLKSMQDVLEV